MKIPNLSWQIDQRGKPSDHSYKSDRMNPVGAGSPAAAVAELVVVAFHIEIEDRRDVEVVGDVDSADDHTAAVARGSLLLNTVHTSQCQLPPCTLR